MPQIWQPLPHGYQEVILQISQRKKSAVSSPVGHSVKWASPVNFRETAQLQIARLEVPKHSCALSWLLRAQWKPWRREGRKMHFPGSRSVSWRSPESAEAERGAWRAGVEPWSYSEQFQAWDRWWGFSWWPRRDYIDTLKRILQSCITEKDPKWKKIPK